MSIAKAVEALCFDIVQTLIEIVYFLFYTTAPMLASFSQYRHLSFSPRRGLRFARGGTLISFTTLFATIHCMKV